MCVFQDPVGYQRVPLGEHSKNLTIHIKQNNVMKECTKAFTEEKAYSLILHSKLSGLECKLVSDVGSPNHSE